MNELRAGNWARAEQRFTDALAERGNPALRAAALIGLAQGRLFERMDAGAAFTVLQSILDARHVPADEIVAGRLHVIAAFLFATPHAGLYDPARSLAHASEARSGCLRSGDPDLQALRAVAELHAAALSGDARAYLEAAAEREAELGNAPSPISRCLVIEVRSLAALAQADAELEVALLHRGIAAARDARFFACEARLLARRAQRALTSGDRSSVPELLDRARGALIAANVVASWVHVAIEGTRRMAIEGVDPPPYTFESGAAHVRGMADRLTPILAPPRHPVLELPPRVSAEIDRLAPSRATVLVVGEEALAGAVARALHDRSPRTTGPFVTVNVRALSPDSVERVLFGGPPYQPVAGLIASAEHGTLHVAAIDRMPVALQPRFLRFLDEQSAVRVVVSTEVDLLARVIAGGFRRDLGERLTLVQVVIRRV